MSYVTNNICEISSAKVWEIKSSEHDMILLDVREEEEWSWMHIPHALHIPLIKIESCIHILPEKGKTIVCYCASGIRSLLAVKTLLSIGFTSVVSLQGGIKAWQDGGYPLESASVFSEEERKRYSRHLLLPEVGEEGQQKLKNAKVLLVGLGGLGCPAASYLAASGVGTLGMIDDDLVSLSNLQRQVLYTSDEIGEVKVLLARKKLLALNNLIDIQAYQEKLTSENARKLFQAYDLIVDGTDNFPTRYLINDVCVSLQKPFVHGSVYRFEGQVSLFDPAHGPCYRCLYPTPPNAGLCPSCSEAGVMGVLPGIIGSMQAAEVIKYLLRGSAGAHSKLIHYDAFKAATRQFHIKAKKDCLCQ